MKSTYINNWGTAASTFWRKQTVIIIVTIRFALMFFEVVGIQWFGTFNTTKALGMPGFAHDNDFCTLK